jgi:hypothetical protein
MPIRQRGAVVERDPRHLGEVLVEQLGDVLGFQRVGSLGEARDVGEEHSELLAPAGELDLLPALEDRGVDLRREILRELAGQGLQLAVLVTDHLSCLSGTLVRFLELHLALLQLRDGRIDRDVPPPVTRRSAISSHQPSARCCTESAGRDRGAAPTAPGRTSRDRRLPRESILARPRAGQ